VAGAALLGAAGCGAESASAGSALSVWYWTGSISDTLLGNVQKKVGVKLEPQKIGGDFKSKFMTSLAGRPTYRTSPASTPTWRRTSRTRTSSSISASSAPTR